MNLKEFSDQDLEQELQRRKKRALNRPALITNPDLSELIWYCEDYLLNIERGETFESSDPVSDIGERALLALYGPSVFTWINKYYE